METVGMSHTTLIASVTGIGVAGVIGPMATAWATRRANQQQFERDQAAKRRADLRDLIDEASVLLGAGAMNLRMAKEAEESGDDEPPAVREWAAKVHLLKQRLLLRLPKEHVVMRSYDEVLAALETISRVDGHEYLNALTAFEAAHSSFLEVARQALNSPISETD
jgi:hypothetical protein